MKSFLVFLFFIIFNFNFLAQNKFEKEFRIQTEEVPIKAQKIIDSFDFNTKLKWYKEIGLETTTFEAKTKKNKKRISIEFNNKGDFEDIEVEIKFKAIPEHVRHSIQKQLSTFLDKVKVTKTQIQYTGDFSAIFQFLTNKIFSNRYEIRYELVITGKKDGAFPFYEFLFGANGELLQKKQIILRNTDNLEY